MKNKIAIITGAGRGIGKGIAEKFANEGHICILIARNSNETKKADILTEYIKILMNPSRSQQSERTP